jgi:histidyl-tRNA synthetase
MNKTQPARGTRDFLPSDVRKREYVIKIIKEVYESYGFEPLETPAFENLETLTGKYGEEGGQLMFKILKRGEKLDVTQGEKGLSDLALRYDLTVPLARVVANYKNDLPKFFKRYQIQPVWRADRPARGRYREFYQCDVDAIGSSSMIVEAELISAVCEILQKMGFDDFVIRVNNRKLLTGILSIVGIPNEFHIASLIALDKLDKIGTDGVMNELVNRGIPELAGQGLIQMFKMFSLAPNMISAFDEQAQIKNFDKETRLKIYKDSLILSLEKVRKMLSVSQGAVTAINELIVFIKLLQTEQVLSVIRIDPSLARGLSYYTGAIFEINVPDLAGSLGGGGRYDGLIGMFGKEQIPACGFSLGLERILVVMEERGMFQKLVDEGKLKLDSADVMIASFDESLLGECLKLAADLRESGLRTLVYPEANQKIKPVKYAEQIDAPFVCLVKADELAENKITFKNMRSGEQEIVPRGEIAAKIKRL